MKARSGILTAAIIGTAWAKPNTLLMAGVEETVTMYVDDCSTGYGNMTAAPTVTSYYCPECEMSEGHLTVYTTECHGWCSSGLCPTTYTLTETCKTPGIPYPTSYVPQGFVVTTEVCPSTICATPTTACVTTPTCTPTYIPYNAPIPPPCSTCTMYSTTTYNTTPPSMYVTPPPMPPPYTTSAHPPCPTCTPPPVSPPVTSPCNGSSCPGPEPKIILGGASTIAISSVVTFMVALFTVMFAAF